MSMEITLLACYTELNNDYVDFEMHGKVQSVSGGIPENSVS